MPPKKPNTIETLTVTPGKGGTRIDADRYSAMKRTLLQVVPKSKTGVEFRALAKIVAKALPKGLPGGGSISWHLTVVKLDLEARGLLERIPGSKPQRLRVPS